MSARLPKVKTPSQKYFELTGQREPGCCLPFDEYCARTGMDRFADGKDGTFNARGHIEFIARAFKREVNKACVAEGREPIYPENETVLEESNVRLRLAYSEDSTLRPESASQSKEARGIRLVYSRDD